MAKKTTVFDDITEVGVGGLKSPLTQQQYTEDETKEIQDAIHWNNMINSNYYQMAEVDALTEGREIPRIEDFGKSIYDEEMIPTLGAYQNYKENRALSQPWYSKLASGISKGAILAGTTFLDGTVGLAYGLKTAVDEGRWSGLWDNDVSNTLAEINKQSEEWLPNYRTLEEEKAPWYRNLGTMNFWADSFIKNMGFTVGAMYSGKVWASPLAAMRLPAIAGEVTGSTLAAINEGRIEANNNVSDWKELQIQQLTDAYQKAVSGVMQDDPLYATKMSILKQDYEKQKQQIDERADSMGMGILLANTVLLSYTNFKTFGKIFSGGFRKAAQDFLDTETKELSGRVLKDAGKYAWKEYSTKEGVKSGLRTGLREGMEEMTQAFISETAGNKQAPDSPDAYYNALLDTEADIQTSDFLTAATKGFVSTYGTLDRWEEFVVGGLTGLLGVPTVGRMNNASANTYLGRNKWIGLSGGLGGEIATNSERNRLGKSAVEIMNNYADRIQDQKDYFVQSQSFINAMDRWSAEGNAFEYKNAEDNDDFAAMAAYARIGKLQDFKDFVNKDFENMSDDDLGRIARYTSKDAGDPTTVTREGWRDVDGNYLSESEEGRNKMRSDLSKKRDKMLKNIDEYVKSVETVRAALHDSPQVTDDQVNELAWLNWKLNRFKDRFTELKEENAPLLNSYIKGLNEYKTALQEEIRLQEELERDDASRAMDEAHQKAPKVLKSLNQMTALIEGIKATDEPLGIASLLKNKDFDEFVKTVFEEENFNLFNTLGDGKMQYADAKKLYNDLQDLTKMVDASTQFNQRYKEFVEDPIKLLENRKKQETKAKATRDDKAARDLASKLEEDFEGTLADINIDEAAETLANAPTVTPEIESALEKLENEKQFSANKERVKQVVNSSEEVSSQAKRDVEALVDKVTTQDDLFAYDSALYNDFRNLYDETDDSLIGKSDEEIQSILQDRLEAAKEAIKMAELAIDKEEENFSGIDDLSIADDAEAEQVPETGNDPTATVEAADTAGATAETTAPAITEDVEYFVITLNADVKNENVIADLGKVVTNINTLLNSGKTIEDILATLTTNESYKKSKAAYPNIDLAISQYISDKTDKDAVTAYTGNSGDVTEAIAKQNDVSLIKDSSNKTKGYWSPIQSSLPIRIADDAENKLTKFYQLVGTPGYDRYTPAQTKYIKAVGKYLDEKGAWQRIDNGLVNAKEEIHFTTDTELNEKAGAFVILITDKEGNVLGNLPTETDNEGNQLDATFGTYVGLKDFVDYVKNFYAENQTMPNVVTHLDKWMIGKILFTPVTEMHTIQEVFSSTSSDGTTTQLPFTLSIAASNKSGEVRIVRDSARRQDSAEDMEILKPLTVRNGQPYILYPTGNNSPTRRYVAVPVMMKRLSRETSPLNDVVRKRLTNVFSLPSTPSTSQIAKVKRELQEVLGGKFNIQVSAFSEQPNDKDVTASLIPQITLSLKNEDGKWEKIVAGQLMYNQDDIANAVETVISALEGRIHYQMALKYINSQLDGADYNQMLAPYIDLNIQPGITHTMSNWFTIKPLEKNDNGEFVEVKKAEKPKSRGTNSTIAPKNVPSASNTLFNYTYKGVNCSIDTSTWKDIYYPTADGKQGHSTLYDNKGNLNVNSALSAAYAYGLFSHQDMTKPYNTQWGTYDPAKNSFVKEEPKVETPEVTTADKDEAELTTIAENKGLLIDKLDTAVWEKLPREVKQFVLDDTNMPDIEKFNFLKTKYNAKTKTFTESDLLSAIEAEDTLFFRTADTSISDGVWNQEEEVKWLGKVLPQFSSNERLHIVDAAIKVANSRNGEYAWGQFKNGVAYIYKGAAKGTLYHEAFHAVTQTLLTKEELDYLYKAAKLKYGNLKTIELEENLAEDFRKYIQYEEDPNVGVLTRMFRKIKHFVVGLFGKDNYIDNMFYRIARGKFSERKINAKESVNNRIINVDFAIKELEDEIEDVRSSMSKAAPEVQDLYKRWRIAANTRERVGEFDYQAQEWLEKNNLADVAEVSRKYNRLFDRYDEGYIKAISKKEIDLRADEMKVNYIEDARKRIQQLSEQINDLKTSRTTTESANALEEQEDRITEYYANKYAYNNLSQEDKDLVSAKSLTAEEYDAMSVEEKENFLYCR